MNILLLNWRDVTHPRSGGAEIVTMEHAKGWVRTGHTVTWVTAGYKDAARDEVVDGVKIIRRLGSQSVYFYVPLYLLLYGHTYDVVVDEVHGFPFFSPLFTNKPVIVFIHEIAGDIWDYMFTFPKNVMGKFLERWYFYIYQHCLFWTDADSTVSELVERGIAKEQCTAIPCPIVMSGLQVMRQEKEKYPTYIFVSRVVRMKGVEEVIKAFSFIILSQPLAQLWIVGGGDEQYIKELRRMISEYHVDRRVQFFGWVSEKEKYLRLQRAHLLLHASVKEGWGLVVLEAAYVGTPSIVYNVGGLRDVVKNGISGIVLKHNSPREMAEQALILMRDTKRYAHMQKEGIKWVKSFSWKSAVSQSLKLLETAYAKKNC